MIIDGDFSFEDVTEKQETFVPARMTPTQYITLKYVCKADLTTSNFSILCYNGPVYLCQARLIYAQGAHY